MTMSYQDQVMKNYQGESLGVRSNLLKVLSHGRLKGTGRLMMLAVDQGFEHGPDRSFMENPLSYDPFYHHQMAVEAGLSAYAAPLGMLEVTSEHFLGKVPTILKINSSNSLTNLGQGADQAVTASVKDALRLGCVGIGFTIYPGSLAINSLIEKFQVIAREAKEAGLLVVVWSYPRGQMTKQDERALDVISYGAHIAALIGAHIIKVKFPDSYVASDQVSEVYKEMGLDPENLTDRIKHVVECCFKGRRIVIFSGGEKQDVNDTLLQAEAIHAGGGFGSIIGRNCFQRPQHEALKMLDQMVEVYKKPFKSSKD